MSYLICSSHEDVKQQDDASLNMSYDYYAGNEI